MHWKNLGGVDRRLQIVGLLGLSMGLGLTLHQLLLLLRWFEQLLLEVDAALHTRGPELFLAVEQLVEALEVVDPAQPLDLLLQIVGAVDLVGQDLLHHIL